MGKVVYTGKMNIGGSGIGNTAMHQVKPLYEASLIKKIYASDIQIPPSMPLAALLTEKIPSVNHPDYYVDDSVFDMTVSLKMKEGDILQSWLGHCYSQFLKCRDSIKIVNLFSAHPNVQERLIKIQQHPLQKEKQLRELELADYIFIPSQFILDSLQEEGLGDKAVVVPFGVDLEKFIPAPKHDNIFRVIFVGSNWERKGGPLLMQAWEKMELQNSELIICGISKESFGDQEFPKNVKVGWVPDLVKALQNSDVFCLPTLEDGCPLATHEAMACGLPIVISENTGTKQYITEGEEGHIIKPDSVDAICEVLESLHTQNLTKMGEKSRHTIEKWPWERFEKGYIDFIQSLL